MRSVSISGRAGFIGSHVTNFYLGSDVQKPVVADNLCTEPFENTAHIQPLFAAERHAFGPATSGPARPLVIERGSGNDTLK